uniref:Uncharacterized protein n=1 Tax=Schlesneria paludicola TaxID=360056 RepID=A0A7C4LMH5_9PLAN
MKVLKALKSSVRPLLDEHFRSGEIPSIDVEPHEYHLDWERSIEPLEYVIDEAMRKFRSTPDKSDAWLAPRVHATLRLTRRQAAEKTIWYWLNIVAMPDYVRWRFEYEDNAVPLDRFVGEDSKNAIGRLWWAAELTRNGPDYSEMARLPLRFFVSWQPLDAMHNRSAAIAVCRFSRQFNQGKGLTDSQSERLAKAFNFRLSTLLLDALAPEPPLDITAIQEWCQEPIDETKYLNELPTGPDENPVPEESIAAVMAVLDQLATEIDLAEFKRKRPASSESTSPSDAESEEVELPAAE